jgi:hypothetical protein
MKIFRIRNGFGGMEDTNLLSRSKFINDQDGVQYQIQTTRLSITKLSECITSFNNAIQKSLTGKGMTVV